jgi:hypothetical protein
MKYEPELAGHLLSIPREIAPRHDVRAWGNLDPDTGLWPIYKATGKLWFIIGPNGETLRLPPLEQEPEPPFDFDAHIAWLHELAAKSKSHGKCYFIGADDGAIKIGFSIDPARRLRDIQACSPIVVDILAVREGGEAREAAYHVQFAEHRLHGEWFARHPDILAEIARLNDQAPHPPAFTGGTGK